MFFCCCFLVFYFLFCFVVLGCPFSSSCYFIQNNFEFTLWTYDPGSLFSLELGRLGFLIVRHSFLSLIYEHWTLHVWS